MLKEVKRLASGKKSRVDDWHDRESNSLLRIGQILSMKDMKGVQQDDMDALMSL